MTAPVARGPGPVPAACRAALLCAALACASPAAESRRAPLPPAAAAPAAPRPPAAPAGEGPRVSARAQRLFDEAVAADEEQRKAGGAPDGEALERRFRAVLDAEELPEAWYDLGVVLEREGKSGEARSAYQRALALRPGFREAAVNLAVLSEPPDPRAAALSYADLAKRFPEDAVVRVRLAEISRAAGRLDEAWRLAREALARDPRVPGALQVMMRVALERGDADLGELLAVRAAKLEPGDPEIAWFLGEVARRRGDEAGAAAQYRKALSGRDYLPARVALLDLSLANRTWEAVVEQGKAVLRRDPGNAPVHLAVGIALRYLGKPDEALAEYAQAESLGGGKLPEVWLARGLLEMKVQNRCEPALADFRRYAGEAGPALRGDAPVLQLTRECEQILATNRQAEEAARQMQRDAERKAAAPAGTAPGAAPATAPGTAPEPAGTREPR